MTTLPVAGGSREHTVDAFLGGKVTLIQPRKGHRAGLDAALLQALVPARAAGLAIDLGSGVGSVAFSVAARAAALSVVGVERDPELVALGSEALTLPENVRLARRVRLVVADLAEARSLGKRIGLGDSKADWVLMNPPFDVEGRGSQSSDARRRDAHVAAADLLENWVNGAGTLLAPGGTLALIHRADNLAAVVAALSEGFGGMRLWPVHAAETGPANRILVTARRGSRAPLTLLPGLVLHNSDGSWTARADALLRGEAELAG